MPNDALPAPAIVAAPPDNPFAWHGIEYLSPTGLNYLRDDMAYGLLKIVPKLKVREPTGPAAPRGTALDKALTFAAYHPEAPDDVILSHANKVFAEELAKNELDPASVAAAKEGDALRLYLAAALPEVRRWGPPEADQGKVELRADGIEVPLIGYYDLRYPDRQRELKTTTRMPSSISWRHARQTSIYDAALRREVWVSYITPKAIQSYRLENAAEALRDVAGQLQALRRFLAVSRDTYELLGLLSPNYEAWCWSDASKTQARALWGY